MSFYIQAHWHGTLLRFCTDSQRYCHTAGRPLYISHTYLHVLRACLRVYRPRPRVDRVLAPSPRYPLGRYHPGFRDELDMQHALNIYKQERTSDLWQPEYGYRPSAYLAK